jgi:membrane-associated phospholipid phosphatase
MMLETLTTTITDLGDLALLGPLALLLLAWLVIRARAAAVAWIAALAVCGAGTALLKIYLGACPVISGLSSPSGHTSMSVLVFGGLVTVLAGGRGGQRLAFVVGGAILALAIALSRIALGAHTPVEVAAGAAIGGIALALFARAYLRNPASEADVRPLVAAAMLVILLLHGHASRAEEIIRAVRSYLVAGGALSCG